MLAGRALGIPFASSVEHVVVLAERDGAPHVALASAGDCAIRTAPGLSGDGRDAVTFDGVVPVAVAPLSKGLARILSR